MTRALLAVAAIALGGCAAAPPSPEAVRFPDLAAPAATAGYLDRRQAEDRRTRSGRMGDVQFHYMGDLAMQPSPLELAVAAVAAALPEKLRGVPIEVRRVEVGFWRARGSGGGGAGTPFMILPGAPVGAVILGNLIGHGIVSALGPAPAYGKGYPFAGAVFELTVGEERLGSYDNVIIDGSTSPELALQRAVSAGLATLRQKAVDLGAPAPGGS